eukprot:GFUD01028134.1.p1 GENE.GFUD01028134.1~~GFUD01028134.1.p1  ORF type:complete len:503 (-),score=128.97 GFUD01028134.1:23-1531(-)
MLMKNKTIDEDYTPIVRKRQRCKKPRDKMSTMYSIPIKVLGLRDEVTTSGGKMKRGKRFGFTVYNALTCKQCRPNRVFHKRIGLSVHNKEMHGKDICSVFKVPNISISQRSRSLPVRNTRTVVPVKKSSSLRAPLIRTKTNTRDNDEIEVIEIDLIDLDDEDSDEIQEIEVLEDGNSDDVQEIEVLIQGDDDDSIVNNNELDLKPESSIRLSSKNVETVDEPEDDDEIECLEVIEVNENRIRSFKPKEYRWMESSPLYQPKVFLTSDLNIKLREVGSEVEEVSRLDESGSTEYNDLPDSVTTGTLDEDDEVIVLGDADPVQLDEATFMSSPHVRNLFDETDNIVQLKRKSLIDNSSSKRVKASLEDEMLLFEEPEDEDEDVLDIHSMLEVSINESEENVSNDSIEVVELEEASSSITEAEPELVMLNTSVEDLEVVTLEEIDEDLGSSVSESVTPKSLKDRVGLWSSEEEATTAFKKSDLEARPRTKKRRSELKPYLNSRGL